MRTTQPKWIRRHYVVKEDLCPDCCPVLRPPWLRLRPCARSRCAAARHGLAPSPNNCARIHKILRGIGEFLFDLCEGPGRKPDVKGVQPVQSGQGPLKNGDAARVG